MSASVNTSPCKSKRILVSTAVLILMPLIMGFALIVSIIGLTIDELRTFPEWVRRVWRKRYDLR